MRLFLTLYQFVIFDELCSVFLLPSLPSNLLTPIRDRKRNQCFCFSVFPCLPHSPPQTRNPCFIVTLPPYYGKKSSLRSVSELTLYGNRNPIFCVSMLITPAHPGLKQKQGEPEPKELCTKSAKCRTRHEE